MSGGEFVNANIDVSVAAVSTDSDAAGTISTVASDITDTSSFSRCNSNVCRLLDFDSW